jgi:hypothetical protein
MCRLPLLVRGSSEVGAPRGRWGSRLVAVIPRSEAGGYEMTFSGPRARVPP